jgi:hypothetical protein
MYVCISESDIWSNQRIFAVSCVVEDFVTSELHQDVAWKNYDKIRYQWGLLVSSWEAASVPQRSAYSYTLFCAPATDTRSNEHIHHQ